MSPPRDSITDRIFSTFPSGQYCLPAMMRILEVVESDEVPSAAVECTARPRMYINPAFVAEHAQTPGKLLMLVMHELHHVVLGHTRLYRRIEGNDNLVFDAVINAMLCRLFPDAEYTELFTDLYSESKYPECFLRPPASWHPAEPVDGGCETPSALQGEERADLAALYRELYMGKGATYDELREAFARHRSDEGCDEVFLLGDHRAEGEGSSSDGLLEHRVPVLLEELQRITEIWPQPPDPLSGRSAHSLLDGTNRRPPLSNRSRLHELLRKVADTRGRGPFRTVSNVTTSVISAVPRADRRSVVAGALGIRTVLYRSDVVTRRIEAKGSRVHVYLDVSGSIGNLVGPLYGAVLSCREFVHQDVHLFSTKVANATLAELRRGVCKSTYGTNIECVAEHMSTHGVRRAVIITDGFVGKPSTSLRAVLKDAILGVAITSGESSRTALEEFATHWVNLTEIKS